MKRNHPSIFLSLSFENNKNSLSKSKNVRAASCQFLLKVLALLFSEVYINNSPPFLLPNSSLGIEIFTHNRFATNELKYFSRRTKETE